MSDLSNWDGTDEFTGEQAAFLILGVDPMLSTDIEKKRVKPILTRMRESFQYDLSQYMPSGMFSPEYSPHMLASIDVCMAVSEESPIENWVNNKDFTEFDKQRFMRQELARWISAVGMNSKYDFNKVLPCGVDQYYKDQTNNSGHWPWGNYENELLRHLEAAVVKWWKNYDPEDITTAPTNNDVSSWLIEERKVTKTKADAIASILRADNLPTGPKKKS